MEESFLTRGRAAGLREWKTLVRFAVVGGSSFVVKAAIYALMSRILWNDGSRSVQNVIALGVAMVYNYLFHRFWTFRAHGPAGGSGPRYVAVVVVASLMDAGLFYVGHTVLGYYDLLVLPATAIIVAAFTFTAHRLFTFHQNPWKKSGMVQSG